MAVYDIGDRRKLTCEVRDEDAVLIDPTALVFTMKDPAGLVTVYDLLDAELVRDSVGMFHVYWDCTIAGKYKWRFAASGNVGAAEEKFFAVKKSIVL